MVAINENSMPNSQANPRLTQRLVDNLYQGGINLYGYVDSSPVGTVDAEGEADGGSPTPQDPNAAETGPIPGDWKWRRVDGSTWEGERGVVQNLGTAVTNGMNPSDYHLLKIIMEIMKSIPVGAGILDAVNHLLDITDFSEVRWRYRITAAWTEHIKMCKCGTMWKVEKRWVSGRHSFDETFGPNNGMVLPGSHEVSQDVLERAFDVAKEIGKYISGK